MRLLDLLLTASLLGYAVLGAVVGAVSAMLMYYALRRRP